MYGELAWDADVQPEGLLAGWSTAFPRTDDGLALTIGAYPILEQANAKDTFL